jgi:hypothetical protein
MVAPWLVAVLAKFSLLPLAEVAMVLAMIRARDMPPGSLCPRPSTSQSWPPTNSASDVLAAAT